MSIPAEHKALIFVGAIAVLGAAVRVLRASSEASAPAKQQALEHQMQRADSSWHSERDALKARGRGRGRGRGARDSDSTTDTTHRRRSAAPRDSVPRQLAPLERKGYIGKRLDLDVATAAQIDSLPGVAPGMAKRIVADRLMRGPFLSMNGLRRVSGVGPLFIQRIDSVVTFSGTMVQPNAGDTVILRRRPSRGGKRGVP
ncbi:MAG TPA: helix-hairpin-helix domain-containing protein [Gemmatimonadaceae bacterium]